MRTNVPRTVAYQGTLVCKYVAYLPKASHGVNRVKVWIGERKRPLRARAAFWFDKSPDKTLGPRQVWVKDSMDPHSPRGPFNRHTHFTYGKQFSCKDAGKQVNTAFLVVPRKHHDRRVQTYGKNDAYRVIDQDSATVHLSCDAKKDPPKCDPSTKGKAPACDPPKKDDPPKSDPPKKDPYPVKVDPTPKQEVIVCAPIKKRDYWTMIGPRGKKTPFFDSGYTYAQIIKKGKRSKNPHYQMARAYVNTMLYIKGGAKYGKKVERSMHWADRYFAAYDPRDSIAKRSPNAHQAKKLRKAIYTKKRVFNRYSKRGNFTRCHAT